MPPSRTDWFTQARFGLFVHWGLYSLAARHEWVQSHEKLSAEHYRRYFDNFRADLYDPEQWAADAKAAGMRYAVLTTKHHDGFCLWDSALTDYKATNTPAGRDLVAEFVRAFRAAGLKVGFYYSLIDWHHPQFPLDGLHPQRNADTATTGRDMDAYTEYLHGQVRELVTRHQPDILWFDFSYPGDRLVPGGKGRDDWQSEKLVAMVRELAPDILLNDRLDLPGSEDFVTPEEMTPDAGDGLSPWETCRTLNGSWGYAPGFQQWLDAEQIARLLVDSASKDGNLLLNVGPTGRGRFEPRARALLTEVGEWLDLHTDAVHGTESTALAPPPDCRLTRRGNRLFVHVLAQPAGYLTLTGLTAADITYASFLHDGAEVRFDEVTEEPPNVPHIRPHGPVGSLTLHLPTRRPDVLLPVIELRLKGELR